MKKKAKYSETTAGRLALRRARAAYDERDPARRRKQKRDYMRRKRAEDPDAWR